MITIALRFIAGRYHATPWGKHVNEGSLEWPPSPYRLLRAIIASWKYNLPEIEERTINKIIKTLSSELPNFFLPSISSGHTRHYMPPSKGNASMIIDTFAIIDKEERVFVIWDNASLDNYECNALEKILKHLHYFGRSESWCDVEIYKSDQKPNCIPLTKSAELIDGHDKGEITEVMTPTENVTLDDLCITTNNLRKKMKSLYPNGSQITLYSVSEKPARLEKKSGYSSRHTSYTLCCHKQGKAKKYRHIKHIRSIQKGGTIKIWRTEQWKKFGGAIWKEQRG